MGSHLERAHVLYGMNRFDEAGAELRLELADDPDNAPAHALLAHVLSRQGQYPEALEEARNAVHLAPDEAWAHYALGTILWKCERLADALTAAQEAVRLAPDDADYHALVAGIHLDAKRWQQALDTADQGLALDPEHQECLNVRATALVKLGRQAEAHDTLDAALTKDPENDLTHANRGWALLEKGQPDEAMKHFREALRLNPQQEWARRGIVEAFKARNLLYRMMLKYFLWISKLGGRAAWLVIIGFFLGAQVLKNLSKQYPELAPYVGPILAVYVAFMLSSWLAYPLFNLLLRTNRFGRLALSREQVVASNWIGAFLLGALLSVGVWAFWPPGFPPTQPPIPAVALQAAWFFGLMLIPLAGTFMCSPGWPRNLMGAVALLLGLAGIGGLVLYVYILSQRDAALIPAYRQLTDIFIWGAILTTWGANALGAVRVKKA